ncbi:heme-binding protein 2-like [Argopecten irradians]|uniref:heme-binding protein 2-like n=1 Tax=Argopecten irradians TaxID=31199 RepID=UPI003717E737
MIIIYFILSKAMKAMLLATLVTLVVGTNAGFLDNLFGAKTDPPGLVGMSNKHWFCHDLDCPAFETTDTRTGYEKRRYESTKWVATNLTEVGFTNAENTLMFGKLFQYISGKNAQNEKIPMTAPVLRRHVPGATPTTPSTYVMYFFVPHNMQTSAPAPTDPSVYLVDLPPMIVYVGSFSGRTSNTKEADAFRALRAELGTTPYSTGYTFTAGYDSPFNILHRHNEVWIPA